MHQQAQYTDPLTHQRIEMDIDTTDYPKIVVQPIDDIVFTDEEFNRLYQWAEEWALERLLDNYVEAY